MMKILTRVPRNSEFLLSHSEIQLSGARTNGQSWMEPLVASTMSQMRTPTSLRGYCDPAWGSMLRKHCDTAPPSRPFSAVLLGRDFSCHLPPPAPPRPTPLLPYVPPNCTPQPLPQLKQTPSSKLQVSQTAA